VTFERRVALRAPSRSDRWDEWTECALDPARATDHRLRLIPQQAKRWPAGWLRPAGIVVLLVVAAGIFARTVNAHYPVGEWLFLRYAKYWLYAALLVLASLSAGLRLLGWLEPFRGAGQVDDGQVVARRLLVAGGDTTEALEKRQLGTRPVS
jgi:hypothetical protein